MSDAESMRRSWVTHVPYVFYLVMIGLLLAVSWGRRQGAAGIASLSLLCAVMLVTAAALAWRVWTPAVSMSPMQVTFRAARVFQKSSVELAEVERWRRMPSEFHLVDGTGRAIEIDLGELSDAARQAVGERLEAALRQLGKQPY
jgi:predicted negative regulator of RcsB-dependent stress response